MPALLGHRGRRQRRRHRRRGAAGHRHARPGEARRERHLASGQVTGVLAANNLTFPSGQITTDGTKIPVSTIGRHRERRRDRGHGRRRQGRRRPAPGVPGAARRRTRGIRRARATRTASPAAPRHPGRPDPGHASATSAPSRSPGVATTGYARTDGQPSLSLTVSKTSDANTVQVADDVTAELDELGEQYADTVTIDGRLGPVDLHQGVARRPGQGGRPGRRCSRS